MALNPGPWVRQYRDAGEAGDQIVFGQENVIREVYGVEESIVRQELLTPEEVDELVAILEHVRANPPPGGPSVHQASLAAACGAGRVFVPKPGTQPFCVVVQYFVDGQLRQDINVHHLDAVGPQD